ncbi:MAG TPA: hypothetical protein VIF09_11420 [Polyangiaceae bacterium]
MSLPVPATSSAPYSIDVDLEIPANVFARHLPWDQLQSWTRLDGGAQAVIAGQTPSVDTLRRGAIGFANKLSRGSEGFSRHARLAGAMSATVFTAESLEEGLELWLAFAVATAGEARTRLAFPTKGDPLDITRERRLVDEYVSVRLLEMLASAERALAALRDSRATHVAAFEETIVRIEEKLALELEAEVAHRDAERWLHPDPADPASLESYIERSSRLKKHFQEVLFLEAETFHVAERLHNWVAICVAVVASSWAFAWQLVLMDHKPTKASAFSSGVMVLALIAGAIYAVKDRIKEIGRAWISGNVHRFYAQRVARWRAPAKRLPGRDVVVRARESFDTRVVRRPDPLSPDSGATMPATEIRYVHRGKVHANPELLASGVKRVKHIFRYDFSPLFARLDDPVKQVPVFDGATRRVAFTAAPRCYRVAVRLRVRSGNVVRDEAATLVLHKRGLDRLEFERGGEAELETGVLPT